MLRGNDFEIVRSCVVKIPERPVLQVYYFIRAVEDFHKIHTGRPGVEQDLIDDNVAGLRFFRQHKTSARKFLLDFISRAVVNIFNGKRISRIEFYRPCEKDRKGREGYILKLHSTNS